MSEDENQPTKQRRARREQVDVLEDIRAYLGWLLVVTTLLAVVTFLGFTGALAGL